jgi:hypothetical protein
MMADIVWLQERQRASLNAWRSNRIPHRGGRRPEQGSIERHSAEKLSSFSEGGEVAQRAGDVATRQEGLPPYWQDAGEEKIPIALASARVDLPDIARRIVTRYFLAKACADYGANLLGVVDRAVREKLAPE